MNIVTGDNSIVDISNVILDIHSWFWMAVYGEMSPKNDLIGAIQTS